MKIKREIFYGYNNKVFTSIFLNENTNPLKDKAKFFNKNNAFFIEGFRNNKIIFKVNKLLFQLQKLKKVFNKLVKGKLKRVLVIVNEKDYYIFKNILKTKKRFLIISSNSLNYYNSKTIMKAKNVSIIFFIFPKRNEIELISDSLRQKKLVFGLINNKLNINFFDYPILTNEASDKAKIFFTLFIKKNF